MRPNIRQIEAFNAVVKCGSVTRAAEDLFVSQPAVTKLIRAFEDACGFPLFIRESGRLRPTPEARRLYLETEKLLLGVAQIDRAARPRGIVATVRAFALGPDQPEIPTRGTETAVVCVKDQDACTVAGHAQSRRCADQPSANDDDIEYTQIFHFAVLSYFCDQ